VGLKPHRLARLRLMYIAALRTPQEETLNNLLAGL
jgi:hypothetical protein